MADEPEQTPQPERTEPPRPGVGERARQVGQGIVRGLGLAAIVIFAVFALANSQRVDFNWLLGSTDAGGGGGTPLILLLLGAFLLGAVVGGAVVALRRRGRDHVEEG